MSNLRSFNGSELRIVYETEYNQIELGTLNESLRAFKSLVCSLEEELAPGFEIKVFAKPAARGSYLIDLDLRALVASAAPLFSSEGVAIAEHFGSLIMQYFKLFALLKGKRSTEGQMITIDQSVHITGDNNVVTAVHPRLLNCYNSNTEAGQYASKFAQAICDDETIQGYQISGSDDSERTVVAISRADLQEIINGLEIDRNELEKRVVNRTVRIVVNGVAFNSGFIFEGIIIKAKLADELYQKRIDAGEEFSKGDVLEVDIAITQIYKSSIDAWLNKSYVVTKVHSHRHIDKQLRLDE